jgi:hypothetical protein
MAAGERAGADQRESLDRRGGEEVGGDRGHRGGAQAGDACAFHHAERSPRGGLEEHRQATGAWEATAWVRRVRVDDLQAWNGVDRSRHGEAAQRLAVVLPAEASGGRIVSPRP